MQILFLFFVAFLFSVEWLANKLRLLPEATTYFPELYFVIFAIAIIVYVVRQRRMDIDPVTSVLLLFLAAAMIGSVVVNAVPPAVMMSGIRIHAKFLPFFLLPMVFRFTPQQIGTQFRLLIAASLCQVPVALYQRFVTYAGERSGDGVGGTLGANSSGIMSVWLGCTIAVVMSFAINGKIPKKKAMLLVAALAVPMMINETKISFFLIPLAVILPVIFSPANKGKLNNMILAMVFAASFFAVLIPVYDSLRPGNRTIVEWFTSEDAQRYVYGGDTSGGAYKEVKRLDTINYAVRKLDYENSLLFGLGLGNVSPSFSREFQGRYYRRYENFGPARVHLSAALWETGLVGAGLFVLLIANNLRISLRLLNHSELLIRSLALAWVPITTIMLATLVYFRMFTIDLINCLFWFYSGFLVAMYARQRSESIESLSMVEQDSRGGGPAHAAVAGNGGYARGYRTEVMVGGKGLGPEDTLLGGGGTGESEFRNA